VTVSTGGVITGFNFVPGTAATMTSPTSVPLHLLALEQAAQPGPFTGLAVGGDGVVSGGAARAASDAQLRSAIVNVAGYYLRLAKTRTPAQMEALIWDKTSSDGTDHGESCAAFASLTLELAAQTVGLQSWVTGGETYPWPLPEWADVRVDTNPSSPGITSLVADAQAHGRWHALGDGYQPQPGDWAVYDGHVEVVTGYADGVLDTVGADSLPGLTVNAHSSGAPLADQGIAGFVDNGNLKPAGPATPPAQADGGAAAGKASTGKAAPRAAAAEQVSPAPAATAKAAVPGIAAPGDLLGRSTAEPAAASADAAAAGSPHPAAAIPGLAEFGTVTGAAAIPGAVPSASPSGTVLPGNTAAAPPAAAPSAPRPAAAQGNPAGGQYSTPGTRDQQAFISRIAPGAIAAQQRFGVPAAVTIAQAIEESAWGRSGLAAQYHNLFGIKGTGPAGSVNLPTSEYRGGQWVTVSAPFRVYQNEAQSIADHAELLATSGYYTQAMADRAVPDAFASDLTGVYATDPEYGANLIALMKLYNLYQFGGTGASAPASGQPTAPAPGAAAQAAASPAGSEHARIPGLAAPALAPAVPAVTAPGTARAGTAAGQIPGLVTPGSLAATMAAAGPGNAALAGSIPGLTVPAAGPAAAPARAASGPGAAATATAPRRGAAQVPGLAANTRAVTARVSAARAAQGPARYQAELPHAVATAFFVNAKAPLARGEHLYRDVAACTGVSWELLAAVDWMQCKADPRYSPVHGEKTGSLNRDGTSYPTKSAALTQCACDLIELAAAVYGIDLTARRRLSVRELAASFAAFRWGALLRRHGVSAMEFPYSVAGLTPAHQKMHWPPIDAPEAPDRPGARFRAPFGAVPVVLSLDYPATV
jgi:flagellum-specific peptidoglycan hydrolase FlgJ